MTMTTTVTTSTLADLERERQRLAYLATQGDLAAVERLDAVEADIPRVQRDTERAALAERERERRDAEQQAETERPPASCGRRSLPCTRMPSRTTDS